VCVKTAINITPLPYSFGTAIEEIFFGILFAKRHGTRIRLLYPFNFPRLDGYRTPNSTIFDLTSQYIESPTYLCNFFGRMLLTATYLPPRLVSRAISSMGRAPLPYHWNFPRTHISKLYAPSSTHVFSWRLARAMKWANQLKNYEVPDLPNSFSEEGWKTLATHGITKSNWFVCLHVRSNGYLRDQGRREHRNSDVTNYMDGIKEITGNGGWVIRLGDKSMPPLPPMPRVIDYAACDWKRDYLDLFFIRNCRFFIGCLSGPWDLAVLFGRPMLTVNMYRWFNDYPVKFIDRGILKQVFSKKLGRFLGIKEIFEREGEIVNARSDLSDDYTLHENTPHEITASVREFLHLVKSGQQIPHTSLQDSANRLCKQHQRNRLVSPTHPGGGERRHGTATIWRSAARIEMASGTISQSYLERNWSRSSR
jgi:putative glycosyltransferase (TIGR04372 family)